MDAPLHVLLSEIRQCRACVSRLPLGPRPVIRCKETARILIIGQAPGRLVHETGIPWNDRSGDRLRSWMNLSRDAFYDDSRIAIMPMGFCYPGRAPNGGDCPPRPECAPLWHERVLELLVDIRLVILVGGYAHARYLPYKPGRTVTETVYTWRDCLPRYLPLPHPSWRNTAWLRRNPWFEQHLLPELRLRVHNTIDTFV